MAFAPIVCVPVRHVAAFGACLWLLTGCAHAEPAHRSTPLTAAAPTTLAKPLARPPVPETPDSIESFMAEHFVITTWARDAVIGGDIEAMREPLRALASYRYDSVQLGSWLPWMVELQQAASLTSRSRTLELAASGVATIGRICGECHRATGGGPKAQVPHQPQTEASQPFTERMLTHVWAVDQLWQGLTTPSDAAWNAGASTLAHLSTKNEREVPPSYARALFDIQNLGVSAQGVTSPAQRADLYAVVLASCADCHVDTIDHAR